MHPWHWNVQLSSDSLADASTELKMGMGLCSQAQLKKLCTGNGQNAFSSIDVRVCTITVRQST